MGSQSDDNIDTSLYILNEKNTLITKKYIEGTLRKYGVNYKIQNIDEFKKAMIHTSYLKRDDAYWKSNRTKNTNKDLEPIDDPSKAIPLQEKSYERLEFLGDSVIHLILAEYFFRRYETQDEGFMTKLRTKIENSETLAALNRTIGLNKYILISRYIEKNGGRNNNDAILEDTFESFMGALLLDGGFEPCKQFMTNLMERHVDLAQILHAETNFKDLLLQYFHRREWADPQYGQLDVSGPDHKKQFTMYVKQRVSKSDDGEIVGTGTGPSKKKGEQDAARAALIHYGIIAENEEEYDSDIISLDESDNDSVLMLDSDDDMTSDDG